MSLAAWFVAAVTVTALGLLVTGRAALDAAGIALIVLFAVTGIVPVDEALRQFGNPTLLALASLYVVGNALTHTGALEFVVRVILRASRGRPGRLVLLLCTASAALSGLVSDTAVVLVMLPVCVSLSRKLDVPVSRLLMPVAFASIFGGTLTLVGSSINLLASGVAENFGHAPLGMFEMTPISLPLCATGVVLTVVLAKRLLPDRISLTGVLRAAPREYVTELEIGAGSPLVGRPLAEVLGREQVELLYIVQDERVIWPPFEDCPLAAGDVLLLRGSAEQIVELRERLGLAGVEGVMSGTRVDPRTMSVFELAVAPGSRFVGSRVRELHLWRDFETVLVAVLRGKHHLRDRASELVLRRGDLLLVCGPDAAQERFRTSQDLLLLSAGPRRGFGSRVLARRALWVLLGLVALFAASAVPAFRSRLPVPLIAMLGAVAMVLCRCVSARRAYEAIDWRLLVFVAGALTLGKAMEHSGLARHVAEAVVGGVAALGPAAVVSGLILAGTVLNQVTSPYAITAVLVPIALAAAESLGITDARPFVLAVAFAGSNAFATPFGHQVNLMVIGPGGYRFSDFLRLGLPLCLYFWLFVSLALATRLE